jgi:hypothetical protein
MIRRGVTHTKNMRPSPSHVSEYIDWRRGGAVNFVWVSPSFLLEPEYHGAAEQILP